MLGLDIDGWVVDVEGILYDDDVFDFVVGYVVLYYIFDVELLLWEVVWVFKLGGCFVFVGELIIVGDGYVCILFMLIWCVVINVIKLFGLRGWC